MIERAIEITTAVEQVTRDSKFLLQFFLHIEGFAVIRNVLIAYLVDVGGHGCIRFDQVGEHRQQLIAEIPKLAVFHVQIQHRKELAIGSGVDDQGFAARVTDFYRCRHCIMGVTAHDCIDTGHATGHLQVDVHTVM